MAYEFYVTVTGTKSKYDKEPNKKIRGLAFRYGAKAPYDVTTGFESGRRLHEPVQFLKTVSPSSPLFLFSLCNSEVLTSVVFEFVKLAGGDEKLYYSIKLTNARVIKVEQFSPQIPPNEGVPGKVEQEYEWIAFTFQKIEWQHLHPHCSADDTWDKS
jgi:type VI secretion system secreted protein Hcp